MYMQLKGILAAGVQKAKHYKQKTSYPNGIWVNRVEQEMNRHVGE